LAIAIAVVVSPSIVVLGIDFASVSWWLTVAASSQ
jgi:hypothetical protein